MRKQNRANTVGSENLTKKFVYFLLAVGLIAVVLYLKQHPGGCSMRQYPNVQPTTDQTK